MGTAVLLPEDCLPTSKIGHKGISSEDFEFSDEDTRTIDGIVHESSPRDLGLAISNHSKTNSPSGRSGSMSKSTSLRLRDHLAMPPHKEGDASKPKGRKTMENKESKAATKPPSDTPVVTILRRPKNKEAAEDLIFKFFLKVNQEAVRDSESNPKLKANELHAGRPGRSQSHHQSPGDKIKPQYSLQRKYSETKLTKCNFRKGAYTMTADCKCQSSKSSASKLVNNSRSSASEADICPEKCQCFHVSGMENHCDLGDFEHLKGLSQLAGLKAMPEHSYHLKKAHLVEGRHVRQPQQTISEGTETGGLARLKRAATDPLIVNQLRSHYKSEVVDISISEFDACSGFAKTVTMSCPERWAGPSYFSSPAPSSLPLPKFFFQTPKMSSVRSSGEGCIRSMLETPELALPCPEPCPLPGAALDAVFATKNLRRILKLDPC